MRFSVLVAAMCLAGCSASAATTSSESAKVTECVAPAVAAQDGAVVEEHALEPVIRLDMILMHNGQLVARPKVTTINRRPIGVTSSHEDTQVGLNVVPTVEGDTVALVGTVTFDETPSDFTESVKLGTLNEISLADSGFALVLTANLVPPE